MKTFKNPEITDFKYTIKTRDERLKFDAIWKQIVKEDRQAEYGSRFAELSILRNLMLGRSMYHGFTPKFKRGPIQNGMPYNHGWHQAYMKLWGALRYNKVMRDYTLRMLSAVGVREEWNITELGIPKATDFDAFSWKSVNPHSTEAAINKMIVDMKDYDFRANNIGYDELFEMLEFNNKAEAVG